MLPYLYYCNMISYSVKLFKNKFLCHWRFSATIISSINIGMAKILTFVTLKIKMGLNSLAINVT
jgi:hypothetical protein